MLSLRAWRGNLLKVEEISFQSIGDCHVVPPRNDSLSSKISARPKVGGEVEILKLSKEFKDSIKC